MLRILLLLFAAATTATAAPLARGALLLDINDVSATNAGLTQPGVQAAVSTAATGLSSDVGTNDTAYTPFT